jgi:YcxB-like protein
MVNQPFSNAAAFYWRVRCNAENYSSPSPREAAYKINIREFVNCIIFISQMLIKTNQFGYEKKQVLSGLRSHFFGRSEIRALVILVNLFAILSAILFYFHKIQPVSFLIFSLLWFVLWITIRRILPLSIYVRSKTFQDKFTLSVDEEGVLLETDRGNQMWEWDKFSGFKETLHFFLLYFNSRSFFMVPKDSFKDLTEIQETRDMMKKKIRH